MASDKMEPDDASGIAPTASVRPRSGAPAPDTLMGTEREEMETMKERFAKLMLGEDMSGSGQGVCAALAISNAITDLSGTVFGELWRLEPLDPRKKAMWRREMDWLLRVTDPIVELIPSLRELPGGAVCEVMVTRPRSDVYVNLPALGKLDDMVLGMLEGFRDAEFWYIEWGVLLVGAGVDKSSSFGRPSFRQEEKWWLPCPKVPSDGLSEAARRRLQQSRDCANQILKAAMAINSSVLAEMEIPDSYVENLPKSGKSCLGEGVYSSIAAKHFFPDCLLDNLDPSSEQSALAIANNLEAAMHVWRRKDQKRYQDNQKDNKSCAGKVKALVKDSCRRQYLVERAELLLQRLKLRYPGLPPTALGMIKTQNNKDVGRAILEGYSRVIETVASRIMARIDDVIYIDDAVKRCSAAGKVSLCHAGVTSTL